MVIAHGDSSWREVYVCVRVRLHVRVRVRVRARARARACVCVCVCVFLCVCGLLLLRVRYVFQCCANAMNFGLALVVPSPFVQFLRTVVPFACHVPVPRCTSSRQWCRLPVTASPMYV